MQSNVVLETGMIFISQSLSAQFLELSLLCALRELFSDPTTIYL